MRVGGRFLDLLCKLVKKLFPVYNVIFADANHVFGFECEDMQVNFRKCLFSPPHFPLSSSMGGAALKHTWEFETKT